jgi:hypothetical protein
LKKRLAAAPSRKYVAGTKQAFKQGMKPPTKITS